MLIHFDAVPDRVRLTAAIRRGTAAAVTPYRGIGLLLGLLAGYALVTGGRTVAAFLAGIGALSYWVAPALVLHAAVESRWPLHRLPSRWEIGEDGVRRVSTMTETFVRWDAVSAVERLPGQLLLWVSRDETVAVPTVGMTPDDREELLAFLRRRSLLDRDWTTLADA